MRSSGAGPSLSPSWCWLAEAVLLSSINERDDWVCASHRVQFVQPQVSLQRSYNPIIYLLPTRCADVEVPSVPLSAAKVFA